MRTIKFRGKRVRDGKWLYGGISIYDKLYDGDKNNHMFIVETRKDELSFFTYMQEIDENTLGQFTGMLDKNGKEIYEGDILYNDEDYFLVYFDENKGMYMVRCYYYLDDEYSTKSTFEEPMSNFNIYEFEIIDNIHDNKELLND